MSADTTPIDLENLDTLVEAAMRFLRYGDGYDHRRNLAKDLVKLVPSLVKQQRAAEAELAKSQAERAGYERALLVMRGAYHATHDESDGEQFEANLEACCWPACVGARLVMTTREEVPA